VLRKLAKTKHFVRLIDLIENGDHIVAVLDTMGKQTLSDVVKQYSDGCSLAFAQSMAA